MQYLLDNFFALTVTGLTLGAVYALVALGYTLVYGVLQLINFAHSEVFMYGTFAVAWVAALARMVAMSLPEYMDRPLTAQRSRTTTSWFLS